MSKNATCGRGEETKKRTNFHTSNWLFAQSSVHPRRRSPLDFYMWGHVRDAVIYFKFHENRLELWEVENCPLPLTWPMAYTTAFTTVQAVTEEAKCYEIKQFEIVEC